MRRSPYLGGKKEKKGLCICNYIEDPNTRSSLIICACVLSRFSRVQFCATLWTVACPTPLSMGIHQVGAKPKCPFKSHAKGRHVEKRRRSCESGDREGSKRSHKPGNTWSHQTLEEARKDSLQDAQEGVWPCQHLDIGLLAPRTVRE